MKLKEKTLNLVDEKIINFINSYDEEEYCKIIENESDIDIILALSEMRNNIINWYPFKEKCSILEIGADYGQITGNLCDKADKVVSLETQEEKRSAIRKRNRNKNNLVIISDFNEICEKFDYITIIGMERVSDKPIELLNFVKQYLKDDGIVLFATDNKLGIKYLSTLNKDGEKETCFIDKKLFTLNELKNQICKAGFENYKMYYPLNDYKLTNAIFTDEIPLSEMNLSRNIIYNESENIKFYEQNVFYEDIAKDKELCKLFMNSFFVEIFNSDFQENGIKMISFSNMRKKEYRIKTMVEEEFVYKYPRTKHSFEHLEKIKNNIDIINNSNMRTVDSYDETRIISKFINEKTLDKTIVEMATEDKNNAINIINNFKKMLIEKMQEGDKQNNVFKKYNIEYNEDDFKDVKFVKNGLWDLIFQNCFYIEGEFYFYDQEWIEENIPIGFIFYRNIKYFNGIKKYMKEEELHKLFEITDKQIDVYEKLDDKLQEKIREELVWKIQKQGVYVEDLKKQKLTDNHTINLLNIEIANKNNDIEALKNEKNKLQDEINIIKNSKSWKFVEILRKFRGY